MTHVVEPLIMCELSSGKYIFSAKPVVTCICEGVMRCAASCQARPTVLHASATMPFHTGLFTGFK